MVMSKVKAVKTVNVVSVTSKSFAEKLDVVIMASFPDDSEGRAKARRFFAGAIKRVEKDIDEVEFDECIQDEHYFRLGNPEMEICICSGKFMA
jgi:predicted amino acid-binding ACT domain protein